MSEIEQLRSDLENAVLERDKALAEADMLAGAWRRTLQELRSAKTELKQFREVVITSIEQSYDGRTGLEDGEAIEIGGEWVSIPFKVFVKDDHV